ncbi:MAG TPA: bacillithiol biosynthesis cysteine-adding enzyme BshC [Terracidiphilus sp.]|jgi:bacillithiol biosynthesis cysteine-adding enzyme BshC|nr:bacillithiol biosynthesis cysteine-adding enzyme BshC [Terracidiphilus sp.]
MASLIQSFRSACWARPLPGAQGSYLVWKVIPLPIADCHPVTVAPGMSRLFLDFCSGDPAALHFYGGPTAGQWQKRPSLPSHWSAIVDILEQQNPAPSAAASIQVLRQGAGTIVTGQQVGLFGGPLFTSFKIATALARAREASAAGKPHVGIFWLASEDHDFAEINHVTFPARRELRKVVYGPAPEGAVPVGGILLDGPIGPLLEQAGQLIGPSEALDALHEAYQPGRTFAQAFAAFYARAFAAQGLLILDASSRAVHRLGAAVLREAIDRAGEFNARLLERNRELAAAGYHAQVAVADNSSLLFLLDEKTGARVALKRVPQSADEPDGLWQAGHDRYSSADLIGILESEPERVSPSALLRPVFQDYLLSTSLTIGGPAEIAYFAQSQVLFDQILSRMTPVQPRLSATIIEPDIAELLRRHELGLDRVFAETQDGLAQLLAARALPIEGKRKLAAAGNSLDGELTRLQEWMHAMDEGLGRSGDAAASKIRYQMDRLRRLAADFQMQKETSLAKHAQAIHNALFPGGQSQERVHGAAWYFARHGFELSAMLVERASEGCAGHIGLWA